MPPLPSEGEIDAIDSGDESDDGPMSTEMLKDICDCSRYHPNINIRKARSKICDHIRQVQLDWKER